MMILLIASLATGGVAPLAAQTIFTRPAPSVDTTRYRTIESCMALTTRMESLARDRDPMAADTFPVTVRDSLANTPLPDSIVTAARTCVASFSPDQFLSSEFEMAATVLLRANRDADVERLMVKQLDSIGPYDGTNRDGQRAEKLMNMWNLLKHVRPIRDTLMIRLVTNELQSPVVAGLPKLMLLTIAIDVAHETRDSTQLIQLAKLAHPLWRELTAQKNPQYRMLLTQIYRDYLEPSMHQNFLDSLSLSVPAYIAARRRDLEAMGMQSQSHGVRQIGDRAERLQGDFWFVPGDTSMAVSFVRPSAGRTSLVVFLSPYCRRHGQFTRLGGAFPEGLPSSVEGCFAVYAMLKRILAQFPSVELTIAAQTFGYFWPMSPVEPAMEASLLRQWWIDYHKLPAALTVTKTSSWRLPNPDRRRINDDVPNAVTYYTAHTAAVLIDREGRILETFEQLYRPDEPWLVKMLTILERK